MMTHRRSTHPPASESAVAWYKIIAISFLVLTVGLFGLVIVMTTKRATITVVAKEDAETVNLTVAVGKSGANTISGTVTTTLFHWSKDYYPGATKTVEGVAKGVVVLTNKTKQPITLKPTTRLLSESNVLFRLKSYTTVPADSQLTAEVYADQAGKAGDIPPSRFTIPGLPTEMQTDIFALSSKPMEGGGTLVGEVTQEEVAAALVNFKEKIKEAYLSINSSTLSGNKQLVSVQEIISQANQKAGAQVKVFTVSGTSTLSVVSYSQEELVKSLNSLVGKEVDAGTTKILSSDAAPQVVLSGVNLAEGSAELKVSQTIVATLAEDSAKLDPANFTDKSRDEIVSYVKSLPHTVTAEIEFSPSWLMRRSPSIPSKIKVPVKMVK